MKNIILITFIFLFFLSGWSQKMELFSDLDIGILSHQSLKKLHTSLINDIPFDVETTDNYNVDYGFTVGVKINSINTSFFYSNAVSGAKSSVSDFSGFFRLTNEIRGSTFGVMYEKEISQLKKGSLFLSGRLLTTSSKLILISESKIQGDQDFSMLDFKFIDYGAGLVLNYKYPVFKSITLKAYLGIDLYLGTKIKFEENNDLFLVDDNGNKVTGGWSGLNTGIGIIFPLIK